MAMMDILKKAAARFGRKSPEMQSARITTLAQEFLDNLTGGLTPTKLTRILADADQGDILSQHQLFGDIEDRDEHIFTELSKRRRALLSLDWSILPARENDARAAKLADAVREQFDALGGYEDLILDLADGIGHGFAALEVEWTFEDGLHLPAAFHPRPQTWFSVDRFDRTTLRLRDGSMDGADLLPFGWVLHRHRSKSGYLPRSGLFRVLVWTYLLKQYARGDFAEYLEVHGMPMRLGKYPSWATDDEKKVLLAALRALGHDAAGIIPQDMAVEFKEAVKSSETPFMTMVDHCERGQSKAILGGTLTSQADGKTSTNALGQVHNEIRHDLLVSDAVQIADTITRQILLPLALLNCGCDNPRLAPWFRFDTSEPEDLALLAEALPKLSSVMRIPASWAHEKCRIPLPEGDEAVLGHWEDSAGEGEEPPRAEATAALAAEAGADPHPDQAALDAALPGAEALNAQAAALLQPILDELKEGLPPEELLARLAGLYPDMDTTALEQQLARCLFVAEVWGRLSASDGE